MFCKFDNWLYKRKNKLFMIHGGRQILLSTLFCLLIGISYAQTAPTLAEERLKGLEKKKGLEQQSIVNHVNFKNTGPAVMSGRVVDVEANPADPTEFYVAYATGGLWHTTNNGQSFKSIFDSEHTIGIGDIAINWTAGKRLIWVGTGEVNSSRSSYAGTGMFKSADSGKTWQYIGLPESHHIGAIVLHPANPDIAWVAVLGHLFSANKERGVYKTADGGQNWKHTLYSDDNTGAVDLAVNPQNPNELYASTWYRTRRAWKFEESGPTGGIYKSTDGGDTWKMVSGPGSGFMTGAKIGRIGICVYPKNPQIVYAVVDNNNAKPADTSKKKTDTFYTRKNFKNLTLDQALALNDKKLDTFLKKNGFPKKYTAAIVKDLWRKGKIKPTAIDDYLDFDDGFQNTGIYGCEVYRSDNGGQSWKKTHEKGIGIYNTYGYYFGKIFVSPVNDKKIFITGFYAQMSTDGGQKFETIDKKNVHPDHHAIWINPSRDSHIINGNDGGLNISYDNGAHWFKANTPAVGQFYSVTTDNATPYNVYGGLQDNGVWYGASNNTESSYDWYDSGHNPFESINGGDGMQVQVDTRDNKTVYSGSQFGVYSRQHLDSNGRDETGVTPRHDLGESPLRFNWQSPILLSRHNPDIFYFGTNRLYRSLNKGDKYDISSGDLTGGKRPGNVPFGTLTTISESPLKFGLLYTGSDDGYVHISRDGGNTFTKINNGLPADLYVSRVQAGAHKESRVYVSMNGYRNDHFAAYLFVSDDYGATWKNISASLPAEPVNVVREDLENDSILYVGTDGGLYVSLDAGNSFMAWTKGLPKSVPIHDITIQQRDNEILLGTHGRSIYVAKLKEIQKLLNDAAYRKEKEAEVKKVP
jgi:photosystem II stability/assembly factor-like uncharacterized protein